MNIEIGGPKELAALLRKITNQQEEQAGEPPVPLMLANQNVDLQKSYEGLENLRTEAQKTVKEIEDEVNQRLMFIKKSFDDRFDSMWKQIYAILKASNKWPESYNEKKDEFHFHNGVLYYAKGGKED